MTESNLRVWHNDNDWVVAKSAPDALAVWAQHTGETVLGYDEEDWTPEPDDKVLTVTDENSETKESKTCAEWAADGPRCLFSRDW